MGKIKFTQVVGGAWAVYQALEQMDGYRRARENEVRVMESLEEARRIRAFVDNPVASDKLGKGRIATLEDARRARMLDPNGLFVGALDGVPLFYTGEGHALCYGRTGSGKGTTLILPNLAHVADRSVVVADFKDGENAFATVSHRRNNLRHRTIALNPWHILGSPAFRLNPLQQVIDLAQAGLAIDSEPYEVALSLISLTGEGQWVKFGAADIVATIIEYLARYRPERCTLVELWRMVYGGEDRLRETMRTISTCGNEALEGQAALRLTEIDNAPEQAAAYYTELAKALYPYRPGSALAESTSASDFDPGMLKEEPTTVYIMAPSAKIAAAAPWISMIFNTLIERIAARPGEARTLFMMDEVANLPYIPAIPKALKLYRGRGIQLWAFCQGRFSLYEKGYSQHTVRDFEDQADILQMWNVEDPSLLRDVELWSGKMAVATRGVTNSGGAVAGASFGVNEHARSTLQVEDIRAIGDGRQIVRVPGFNLFVTDRIPWFRIDRFRQALRDPRDLHQGRYQPPAPLPPPLLALPAPAKKKTRKPPPKRGNQVLH